MTSFQAKCLLWIFSVPFLYGYHWSFQAIHLGWFGVDYPHNWVMKMYWVGLFLHMSYRTIEETELACPCDMATGVKLDRGWIVAPNFLHTTVSLFTGFSIVCGIHVPSWERAQREGITMVEHYRNQNQGNYNANTTVDPLTWALMRFSEATGFWVFKVPHLIPMRLGFLFMVAAFVISVVHATGMKGARALGIPVETPQVAESSWKFSFPSLKVPEVQLPQVSLPSFTKAQRPPFRFVMPPDELYQINEDRTANKFSNDVIARGTKYYQYNAPDDRGRSVLEVQEELCAAVPAGKDVYFLTQIPPTHWHNMEKGVVYVKKFNHYTFTDWKDALFGSGSFHLVREDPIEVVTADWKRVWKKDLIKMRALTSPETGKGGVVCFIEE